MCSLLSGTKLYNVRILLVAGLCHRSLRANTLRRLLFGWYRTDMGLFETLASVPHPVTAQRKSSIASPGPRAYTLKRGGKGPNN
jgi:hypothetical protein